MRSRIRSFHAYARYQADEAIWWAQLITWLPVVNLVIGLVILLVTTISSGDAIVRRELTGGAWSLAIALFFVCLYGLAGAWIGSRQARGVWLAIALFGWSLAANALHGHLLSFNALYDLLALSLIVRAGRAFGVRYLTATAR